MLASIKAALGTAYSWVKARAAENSTKAGLAAFLAAVGAGAATLGSPRGALTLFAGAAVSGLSAAIKADPNLAAIAAKAVSVERVAGPVVAELAEAALPAQAASIAAGAAAIGAIASQLDPVQPAVGGKPA